MMELSSNEGGANLPGGDALRGELAKRFKVINRIGDARSGARFLAADPQLGDQPGFLQILGAEHVASAAERKRLKRELSRQATLTSRVMALPVLTGEADGSLWIFRPFVEGQSLAARLSEGPLGLTDALAVGVQIALGLEELHHAGLLHRNLHPGHVIVRHDHHGVLRATLIDIGITRRVELERPHEIFGTPGYIAPEQVKGKLTSFRSDLYSLGCVLYRMLAGSDVYSAANIDALLEAHSEDKIPALSESIPGGVRAIVQSLLAKDPRERLGSAEAVRTELEALLPEALRSAVGGPVASGKSTLIGMPAVQSMPPPPPSAPPSPPGASMPSPPPGPARVTRSIPPTPPMPDIAPSNGKHPKSGHTLLGLVPEVNLPHAKDPTMQIKLDDIEEASQTFAKVDPDGTQQLTALDIEEVEHVLPRRSVPPPPPDDTSPNRAVTFANDVAFADTVAFEAVAPDVEGTAIVPNPFAEMNAEPDLISEENVLESFELMGLTVDDIDSVSLPPSPFERQSAPSSVPPTREFHGVSFPPQTSFDQYADRLAQSAPLGLNSVSTPPTQPMYAQALPTVSPPLDAYDARPSAERRYSGPTIAMPEARPKRRAGLFIVLAAAAIVGPIAGGIVVYFLTRTNESQPVAVVESAEPNAPAIPAPVVPAQPVPAPAVEPPAAPASLEELQAQAANQPPDPASLEEAPADEAPPAAVAPAAPAPEVTPAPVPASREETAGVRPPVAEAPAVRTRPEPIPPRAGNSPDSFNALREQARAHMQAGRYPQALAAYQRAASMNPGQPGIYAGMGAAYLALGQASQAIGAYQRAIQLDPGNSGFYAALGRAYLQAGDRSRAIQSYQRSLALNPNNTAARNALQQLGM